MEKFYLIVNVIDGKHKYVSSESDIDMGGFVDAEPENFGFATRQEAERVKNELVDYIYNKACEEDKYYEQYHTRDDVESSFYIEEITPEDNGEA